MMELALRTATAMPAEAKRRTNPMFLVRRLWYLSWALAA